MAAPSGVKRPSSDSDPPPPAKKPALLIPTLDLGPVTGEEDLDIKVLKVQNKKLSQRLRERNHSQTNLEGKVDSLQQKCDDHSKLVISLRRMLTSLKDQLSVLCAPLGSHDDKLTNEIIADIGVSPNSLEGVFQCVSESVYQLGEAISKGGAVSEDIDLLSVVREIQTRNAEHGNHDDDLSALESKVEELGTALADTRFDLFKSESRCEQLEVQLTSTLEELTKRPVKSASPEQTTAEEVGGASPEIKATEGVSNEEIEHLKEEIAELQSLAESRSSDINDLANKVTSLENEKRGLLEEKQRPPSKDSVLDSAVYKGLQTQYTVAVQEIGQLKNCLEEVKQLLVTAKQQHMMCLEEIRNEEVKYQAVVRDEMTQLETALVTTQREYELLKVTHERAMASNEQAAPRAKELQVMVDSVQKVLTQAKSDVSRYKARAHKAEQELAKVQSVKTSEQPAEGLPRQPESAPEAKSDQSQEMSAEIKKLKEEKNSLENELSSLKSASTEETKEKAEIIANEKKYRAQVEELKKRFEDYRKDYEKRKEHIKEEAAKKSKSLAEDNKHLQKELSAKKHEAQALVNEMDCTAQAFDEMQEQNMRLLEQIKEKDDANFKLMSERIKSNSVHKLLQQERVLMQTQLSTIATENQRLSEHVLALQNKDQNAELSTKSLEKELSIKNQAVELHKRKAQESVQMAQESALALQEETKSVNVIKQSLTDQQSELQTSQGDNRKLQEEIGSLKRRLEKYKSREWAASGDEVLLEEIRTYKVKLNCPCCSTRKKDTVLTKCFHVFCSECIRSRYDSRLRKCPKCGAAFGANDFHKIYLS